RTSGPLFGAKHPRLTHTGRAPPPEHTRLISITPAYSRTIGLGLISHRSTQPTIGATAAKTTAAPHKITPRGRTSTPTRPRIGPTGPGRTLRTTGHTIRDRKGHPMP